MLTCLDKLENRVELAVYALQVDWAELPARA
jgi:hypothetical protein